MILHSQLRRISPSPFFLIFLGGIVPSPDNRSSAASFHRRTTIPRRHHSIAGQYVFSLTLLLNHGVLRRIPNMLTFPFVSPYYVDVFDVSAEHKRIGALSHIIPRAPASTLPTLRSSPSGVRRPLYSVLPLCCTPSQSSFRPHHERAVFDTRVYFNSCPGVSRLVHRN